MTFWESRTKIASWLGAVFLILSTILVITPSIASAATITQTPPTDNSTTTTASSSFTDQLEPTIDPNDIVPTSVTYATVTTNPNLSVSSTGAVSTSGILAANSYTVSGTTSDGLLDSGTWTYTLTVNGVTITQSAPLSGTSTQGSSNAFSDQLEPTTFNGSAVIYTTSVASAGLSVSSTGAVSTPGILAANSYTDSGTDVNSLGDSGNWSYTLTVTSPSGGPPPPSNTTLVQTSPTTGTATTGNSSAYTGSLAVSFATGAVTYLTVTSSPALSVSAQGNITTSGPLVTGTYTVSGSNSDPQGDTGTWVFSLTVNASITVTFGTNGGEGSMPSETKASPTALTPNEFTWSKHMFDQWNTAADGSGTSFANGAVYPFTKSTTLYAQWTATTHVDPKRTVTFDANGGGGSMSPEAKNALASLTPNNFTRAGFKFVNWNTAANGSGSSYDDSGAYKFTKSTTLYAQWNAAATFSVQFHANGGGGSMKTETKKSAAPLTRNQFTRNGFKFIKWSTAGNGSGSDYANGQSYGFETSISLYAQWSAVRPPVVPPAIRAVVALNPFGVKSSALSNALESQITSLANEIQTNHDKKISLVGYSGDLTTANATNESDWAASLKLSQQRAFAVEEFLKLQLASLGITKYTISAVGNAAALQPSANATPTEQARNRKVVATIS
jgi:outer membrane protein OmpA-like peptidoglycan-associated protein/methionine-rich copper-binding protein CopC